MEIGYKKCRNADLPEVLRRSSYCATLSREELAQIVDVTVERHYKRSDLIMLEG